MKASDRLKIPKRDLRRDVMRAGGPGGQHQNKTESAVRYTHLPSGIQAESRTDKSQHRNDEIAYERLCQKLLDAVALARGSRPRGEPATFGLWRRSYRLVGNAQCVEDIPLGLTLPRAADVLNGGIDPFIDAALRKDLAERDQWEGGTP